MTLSTEAAIHFQALNKDQKGRKTPETGHIFYCQSLLGEYE